MKKNKILFFPLVLALVLITIGCTVNRPGTQTRIGRNTTNNDLGLRRNNNMLGINRRNTNLITDRNRINDDNLVRNMDSNMLDNNMLDNSMNNMSTRANAIARRITNLNEVNRCSVLLSGDTAIVGVDINDNFEGKMSENLKIKIENIVKDMDNNITNVSVTADPDLFTRISNMAKDIREGRPITGFARQFQEILRRISPTR
ncbi:YhcN/YlaJ family sporulation lipoprotein [Tepidimicrobium xylanilyticum]|uniref:Sporulation lipoprotein, YhcN/YlaJ family n=1 Tax=Tepidimicrobium xylanilyticum TaxID=1123352 RepID=A0A1H3CPB9_9FIRM|nr:YhcN/YlaJ family sporulation lipoprotein [Tepidimicrobium xylanilyticum]SDX55424.1 sporulation lipoprotein, YhcN/YlaJ family [Tepidimicrobium xylanilyticum]